jgi:hypothetical protein
MQQRKVICCNIKPKLLQQQKQSTMRDATSEKRLMQQRKITCCNIKQKRLQQQCYRNNRKNYLCNNKTTLLQQQKQAYSNTKHS